MNKRRVRTAARQDAEQVAKIIQVQEAQIAALKAEVAALEAVLIGVCEMYAWDHVDPETGEVAKGWPRPFADSGK